MFSIGKVFFKVSEMCIITSKDSSRVSSVAYSAFSIRHATRPKASQLA